MYWSQNPRFHKKPAMEIFLAYTRVTWKDKATGVSGTRTYGSKRKRRHMCIVMEAPGAEVWNASCQVIADASSWTLHLGLQSLLSAEKLHCVTIRFCLSLASLLRSMKWSVSSAPHLSSARDSFLLWAECNMFLKALIASWFSGLGGGGGECQ